MTEDLVVLVVLGFSVAVKRPTRKGSCGSQFQRLQSVRVERAARIVGVRKGSRRRGRGEGMVGRERQ